MDDCFRGSLATPSVVSQHSVDFLSFSHRFPVACFHLTCVMWIQDWLVHVPRACHFLFSFSLHFSLLVGLLQVICCPGFFILHLSIFCFDRRSFRCFCCSFASLLAVFPSVSSCSDLATHMHVKVAWNRTGTRFSSTLSWVMIASFFV